MKKEKFNPETVIKKVNEYVINCISTDGYNIEATTQGEKLKFLADCFINEYCFADNLKRYKTYQNVFAEWIKGLPTVFNIDFYNEDILKKGIEWNLLTEEATEEQEDRFIERWFSFIASTTLILFKSHGIELKVKD